MSKLEDELEQQLALVGLMDFCQREYRFDSDRLWRFDFAWAERHIAAEVEGGTWSNGRHTRGAGFEEDCRKYNTAAAQGWRVFRFTGAMIRSGEAFAVLQDVLAALPF